MRLPFSCVEIPMPRSLQLRYFTHTFGSTDSPGLSR